MIIRRRRNEYPSRPVQGHSVVVNQSINQSIAGGNGRAAKVIPPLDQNKETLTGSAPRARPRLCQRPSYLRHPQLLLLMTHVTSAKHLVLPCPASHKTFILAPPTLPCAHCQPHPNSSIPHFRSNTSTTHHPTIWSSVTQLTHALHLFYYS